MKGATGGSRSALRNDAAAGQADDDDHHDMLDAYPHNDADLRANLDECERQLTPLCDQAALDLVAERWARE